MTSNEYGKTFKITTFGESHGQAIGVLIDGIKANIKITKKDIQRELDKRKPGKKFASQRKESDQLEIISGIYKNKTLGTPICLLIQNKDANPSEYEKIKDIFRPGHAGYTYFKKYGIRDPRGGGRSSGRETAARVAAGAIAKKILKKDKIKIIAYTKQIQNIKAEKINLKEIEKNPLKCPDKNIAKKMQKLIEQTIKQGDSLGGIVEIIVKGLPAGIGEPIFNKLDAELSKSLMSIGAVKGIEIGLGFESTKLKGSQVNDQIKKIGKKTKFLSNNSGGILGGISTGQDIIIRIAIKPTSSISKIQQTISEKGQNKKIKIKGRHDPCICPRIVPVAEAMVAITLLNLIQIQKERKK